MAYYLKMEILSGWSGYETEVREIEFYNDSIKIDKSKLSIVSATTTYAGGIAGWAVANIINGDTTSTNSGCDFVGDYPKYVIIKSTEKFNNIKVYNDVQSGYAMKEAKFYVMNQLGDPTRESANWVLKVSKLVSDGTNFLSGLSTTNIVVNTKYLIKKDGLIYTINNSQYNTDVKNYMPLDIVSGMDNVYKTYGFDSLSQINNIININNESFKPMSKFGNFKIIKKR